MLYLDANATEPLRASARAAVLAALDTVGNPSSVHAAGRAARRLLEDARETVAACFRARPADVVFTSGGTEADALGVHALRAGRRLIVGATEHDAVRAAGGEAAVLPVDREGVAVLGELARLLAESGPALVCLMFANNETGTVQPVAEAASLCRRHGALLHVDAVQAAGRISVDFAALGAHSMALSSHKIGGPPGAGALLLAPEVSAIAPLIAGGGQERGRRGGTPALPAIVGFAAAAREAGDSLTMAAMPSAESGTGSPLAALHGGEGMPSMARNGEPLATLRDAIERAAVAQGAVVCGGGAARLANTTSLALPGIRADAQVIALDLQGVAVSAGAACSSGKVAASHVLAAMGLGALAGQAIRVSLPWNAPPDAAERFADAYARMAERLRRALSPHAA
jgi:cysteine desulfurase